LSSFIKKATLFSRSSTYFFLEVFFNFKKIFIKYQDL